MESLHLVLIAVALLWGLGTLLWRLYFSPRARARAALAAAPRLPVAEVQDGQLVKLSGVLRMGEDAPVIAPLSGRPCAYYEVEVDERSGSGRSRSWRQLIRDREHCASFWLQDSSGRALVEVATPRVVLTMDTRRRSGWLDDPTPQLEELLGRYGEQATGWLFNRTLRYREGKLEEGEVMAVMGVGRWEPDPNPSASGQGYRSTALRLRVTPPAEQPMLLSDDPRLI